MRSFHFPGRSPVYGRRAMCATSHPAGSLAAIDILKAGGNAVDAAIATAAVLAVVECPMTGIGGDCFAILAKPGSKPIALNAAGRAPKAATAAWYAKNGIKRIDTTSVHAVTVPGAVDGWCRLLEDHGSMPLDRLLAPAIELAERGVPVAPRVSVDWARAVRKFAGAGAKKHLLKNGRPPAAGEVMRFPALAATLQRIAKDGRDGFYRGPVAKDMVAELKALGGLHTLDDFAAQASSASYVEPISVAYRGLDLNELPPSNQGIVALVMLKMLARLGKPAADPVSPERYHVLMEVARLAYAMRDTFVADPDKADVPVEHMLDDELIETLVARIDRKRRTPKLGPIPRPAGSDTVYFAIVDEQGMAVSFINSLYGDFGTGIVTAKTGRHLPQPRRGLRARCQAPQLHRAAQAPAAHAGAGHGHAQRRGGPGIRRDGGPLPADRPRLRHVEPDGLWHGPAGGHRLPAGVLRGRGCGRRAIGAGRHGCRPEGAGPSRAAARATLGRRAIVAIDRDNGVLIGASDGRKDGMALG